MRGTLALRLGGAGFGGGAGGGGRVPRPRRGPHNARHASSSAQPAGSSQPTVRAPRAALSATRVGRLHPRTCCADNPENDASPPRLARTLPQLLRTLIVQAALTNATLAVTGDLVAQARPSRGASRTHNSLPGCRR
jgi:hypothetical protein